MLSNRLAQRKEISKTDFSFIVWCSDIPLAWNLAIVGDTL